MAFPSEVNYSPAAPQHPSPWPSTAQHLRIPNLHLRLCLHLLFHQNYPPKMQYNWLESETQCALMYSILNSLRDRLWFNRLKDTKTWSWNVMQCFESHTSPLPSPPWTPPSSHHHLHLHLYCLHLCKKKYCIKVIFNYFLFNADLSKFDSQYYNIRCIHSLLLNSRPWTETINTQL